MTQVNDGAASPDAIAQQFAQVPEVKILLAESARYLPDAQQLAQFCIAMLGNIAASECVPVDDWQRAVAAGHAAVRIILAEQQKHAASAQGNGNARA